MLGWHEPKAGDTFFTPAGTVHALGASLAVCEIQQNSDVTYRLYDYQRGRPLHLDKGLEVANLGTHPGPSKTEQIQGGGTLLVSCEYFVVERWQWTEPAACGGGWIIIVSGRGTVEGVAFEPGQVWRIGSGSMVRPENEVTLLRTYVPEKK
jgi:mannose-6-phosphate isomerase